MDDCIFCKIIRGDAPVSLVYEDEIVVVILDVSPINEGHAMVIPKEHVASLAELDEHIGMHLFKITQRTATALRSSDLLCEGINLLLADGKVAFQEVPHIHMHIVPRLQGDSFKIEADWDRKPSRNELNTVATKIRRAYKRLWG